MGWLDRAQRNPLGVGAVLYVPTDHDSRPVEDYQRGIDIGVQAVQMWYWKQAGKTFRRYPCVIVQGSQPAAWFATQGTKESFGHILDVAASRGLYVGGRQVDKADDNRIWMCFAIAPLGYVGNMIGVDNYRADSRYGGITGRTGLQGFGLELMAMNYPAGATPEGHVDTAAAWWGALCHELGHCFPWEVRPGVWRNLGHPSQWAWTVMFAFWHFMDWPAITLSSDVIAHDNGETYSEVAALRASPYFR